MSPSDLLRETGLTMSMRQFRRYFPHLDGVVRGKRGHYRVVGPVTEARLQRIRDNVAKLGRTKSRRPRPPSTNPRRAGRTAGVVTIEGILAQFDLWRRRIDLAAIGDDALIALEREFGAVVDFYDALGSELDRRAVAARTAPSFNGRREQPPPPKKFGQIGPASMAK